VLAMGVCQAYVGVSWVCVRHEWVSYKSRVCNTVLLPLLLTFRRDATWRQGYWPS
jgi:hypothetical protein